MRKPCSRIAVREGAKKKSRALGQQSFVNPFSIVGGLAFLQRFRGSWSIRS
jgi:hypothetical protein